MKQFFTISTGFNSVKKLRSRPSIAAFTAAAIISSGSVSAIEYEYDLTPAGNNSYVVPGDVGGDAIFSDHFTQPAGTGVFNPFLTLDANGPTSTGDKRIEQAYNTDGEPLYLDQLRNHWNTRLILGNLAKIKINIGGPDYYAFLLDANEPGADKSVISVDNVRIYTSSFDNTAAVGNTVSALNNLGTLRWALNDPTKNLVDGSFNIDNWIKLDSNQENVEAGPNYSNGGSGKSDMIVYIPVSAFGTAAATDYVWFYNLNGVHYDADKDLAAQAGFEEWAAFTSVPGNNVPDGGTTVLLLTGGLFGLRLLQQRLKKA